MLQESPRKLSFKSLCFDDDDKNGDNDDDDDADDDDDDADDDDDDNVVCSPGCSLELCKGILQSTCTCLVPSS